MVTVSAEIEHGREENICSFIINHMLVDACADERQSNFLYCSTKESESV